MYKVLVSADNLKERNELIFAMPWDMLSCTVYASANGREAMEEALKIHPNIIIIDITCEEGTKTARSIKKMLPEVLFVFLTDKDTFPVYDCDFSGANSVFVEKSSDVSELTQKVENFCWKIHENHDVCSIIIEYKKQLAENKEFMLEKFLTNHLAGISKDQPNFLNRARYMGINMRIPYMLTLFQIDNTDNMQNTYSMQFHLKKLIERQFIQYFENMYCITYDSQMVVLMLDYSTTNFDKILSSLYRIQELFTERTQMHVTVCLSKSKIPFEDLSDAFLTQYEILKREYFTKSGSIIIAEEMHTELLALDNAIKSDLYSEISAILLGDDRKKIYEFVDKYYSVSENLGEVQAKILTYNIVNSVNSLLIEQNLSFEAIFDNEFMIWEQLVHFNSITNIPQWLKNILSSTYDYLKKRPESTLAETVSQIKQDIDKNFATIQSLNQITDKLFFSSGYASKLFKKYTNLTINEYLLERRISEAKKLLKNKSLKSSEIAVMVGYQSNTYFTTVFKKHTGMTPTEYRNSL